MDGLFPVKQYILPSFVSLAAMLGGIGVYLPLTATQAIDVVQAADVPYVPTPQPVVERMLDVARVGSRDYVIDLGSGDGRIVLTAVTKYGARGLGVDLNPEHIRTSKQKAQSAGVADRAEFVVADLFDTDVSKATVVTMYLLPNVNLRLRPQLFEQLKPGARVVSHNFTMDDWKPDRQVEEVVNGSSHTIYYWVIPAKVEGRWTMAPERGDQAPVQVMLTQKFQELEGTVQIEGREMAIQQARIEGDRISFTVPGNSGENNPGRFDGRVRGDSIEGTLVSADGKQAPVKWRARRTAQASASPARP